LLRIHLTAEDLLRIKFASEPAPLIDVGHALAALQRQDPVFGRWRRGAAPRIPVAVRPLLGLVPPTATAPLFLDPISASLAEGLEQVQRTPRGLVASELSRVFPAGPPRTWVRLLAEHDRQTWRDLDRALSLAYRHLLADSWSRLRQAHRAELAWRSRLIAESGVQATLSALHPAVGWDGPVLLIKTPREWDFRPGGAGLTLLPSALWTGRPMATWHPDGSVAIIYAGLTPLPLTSEAPADPLAGLLGHTRAALLRLSLAERTTTELARGLEISLATVSSHTKALRQANLIVSIRSGKAVLHSATPLGARLVEGCSPPRSAGLPSA
jgi:DNA-binding transcriptional ArsR family regulator